MEGKKVVIDRISKILVLLGIISFVTYFVVRMYAISGGGSGEFYGVRLFMPDRFLLITAISTFLVICGVLINLLNTRYIKAKQIWGKFLERKRI